MKQLALYREFRPSIFDEVIGQDHIVKTLQNQVKEGTFAHAYLFCGTRGTGKTSIAKIFAKAINCKEPVNGNPCGKCESCSGNNIDVIEIDAASNNGVDKIRELRENIKFLPLSSKYKVYIIDEVHMLSEGAFNALLKTLEEPPAHAVFILATTEVQKLPQTILSRCIRFDFKLVSKADLTTLLKKILNKIGAKSDDASLEIIVSAGEGSVRDTLSIADRCVSYCENNMTEDKVLSILGGVNKETVLNLTDDILNMDIEGADRKLNQMLNDGKSVNNLIKELLMIYKDLTLINVTSDKDVKDLIRFPITFYSRLCELSKKATKETLRESLNILSSLESELKTSTMGNLLLNVAIFKLALLNDGDNPVKKNDNLVIRASQLETQTSQKKTIIENDEELLKKNDNLVQNTAFSENIATKTIGGSFNETLGLLLIELRESSNVVLALMMADIVDGFIDNNTFTIYCKKDDEKLLNNNKKIFEDCFLEIGINLNFKAIGVAEKKNGDITTSLEKMFGNKLIIE